MSIPTVVQETAAFYGLGSTKSATGSCAAATAGNLLVVPFVGDKNAGTASIRDNIDTDGSDWIKSVELLSGSVCLYVFRKVAAGGENSVTVTWATTGSTTARNPGQIIELAQTGTGAWGIAAQATNITNESAVASWASGTTGAAATDGLALGIFGSDSWETVGSTTSWSNAYNEIQAGGYSHSASTGGGSPALYVATKAITAGQTTTTTLTTSGGDATPGVDQFSGAVLVFGRAAEAGDTTPPSVPTGLVATPGNAQVGLAWTASTDNVGVTGYRIRRGGTVVGTAVGTTFTDTGRTNGVQYSYTVAAYDAAGNESAQTAAVLATPSAGTPTVTQRWLGVDRLAVKTTLATTVRVAYSTASNMASPSFGAAATPDAQGVSLHALPSLAADTPYWYQVEADGALVGSVQAFRTLPGTDPATFTFAFASCRAETGDNGSAVFGRLVARAPDLFLETGDLHYRDINSTDASLYRAAYDALFTVGPIVTTLASIPTTYTWSDHDYCGNGSGGAATGQSAVRQVYRERVPSPTLPDVGVQHTFRVGRARFVVLDTRSYRSPVGNTDNSSKSMLGAAQKTWLQGLLATPDTPLIFIVSAEGWVSTDTSGDDWGRYQTERTEIAGWITASSAEVVFLCGDAHMLGIDNGTNAAAGCHVWHAAALNQTGSTKGGPYSGGTLAGTGQYGFVTVTDSDTQIVATFQGIKSDETVWNSDTVTVSTIPPPDPDPPAATATMWMRVAGVAIEVGP